MLTGADPAPVQSVGSAPLNQPQPHLTPAFTVPANGLALAWLLEYATPGYTPATCNAPTEFIAEVGANYQSEVIGLALGKASMGGQASFSFAFGSYARCAVVFKAEGT
ncbi:hypothetical protein J4558_07350 [Leptolyngbya sp. 15MV]|nr:hypothetical protein J4558_07350 [Leptolyngbya sp. 15MV]